jgi:hypothetical protein
LLEGSRSGERVIVALAALHGGDAQNAQIEVEVLEAIADALIHEDVVDAVTRVA